MPRENLPEKRKNGPTPPKPSDPKKHELDHSIVDPVNDLTSALANWSPQGRGQHSEDQQELSDLSDLGGCREST